MSSVKRINGLVMVKYINIFITSLVLITFVACGSNDEVVVVEVETEAETETEVETEAEEETNTETNEVLSEILLEADGEGDTYELINSVLAPNYDVIEAPDCSHEDFGRHIDELFDNDLEKNVFRWL